MNKHTLLATVVLTLGILGTATSQAAFASNKDYNFGFTVKGLQRNTRTAGRKRSTTNNMNEWKVNLQKSTEGSGAVTTFWLENYLTKNVSSSHNVPQGSGAHYYTANDGADNTTVYLTAQNNNFTTSTYNIAGYWDEETGKIFSN